MGKTSLRRQQKRKSRWQYLFLLLLVLITDSGIIKYGGTLLYYFSMLILIIGAFVVVILIIAKQKATQPLSFWMLSLLLLFICSFSLLQGTGVGGIIKYLSMMLLAYYIAFRWNFPNFALKYTHICLFIGFASLVMLMMYILFPALYYSLPSIKLTPSSGLELEYKTIGIANMIRHVGEIVPRMYGPFWEPGVCQAYFNIALLFSLLLIDGKKQIVYIIIFTLCIWATQSTTGYIAWALIICFYLLSNSNRNIIFQIFKVSIAIGITILLLSFQNFSNTYLYSSVFGKLESGLSNVSFSSRYYSIIGNIRIIINHPIIGVGLNNSDTYLREFFATGYNLHQTNTLTNYYATFGILIGTLYFVSWIKFVATLTKGRVKSFLCIFAIIIILSGQNFLNSMIFTIFLMYGYLSGFYFDTQYLNEKKSSKNLTFGGKNIAFRNLN